MLFYATQLLDLKELSALIKTYLLEIFISSLMIQDLSKMGMVLEYLKSVDGTTHPSRQIVAIQGDGTNGDMCYIIFYLSYSITKLL